MTTRPVYANIYDATAHGGVAQLGERTVRIRKVEGSTPFVSTILEETLIFQGFFFFLPFAERTDKTKRKGVPYGHENQNEEHKNHL